MDEEREREPLKFRNSKTAEIMCKIAMGVLFYFSLCFYCGTIFSLYETFDRFSGRSFDGYYAFSPNSEYYLGIMNDSSKEDSLLRQIGEWQREKGLKVIQFRPDILYRTENYTVYSYLKPKFYEVEWQEAGLEMREGEWFQNDEEACVIVRGSFLDVGDEVIIKDSNGKPHSVPIVGKTKRKWVYGSGGFVDHIKFDRKEKTILFLNPACALNPEAGYIEESTLVFQTSNPGIIQSLQEIGNLRLIEKSISKEKKLSDNLKALIYHFKDIRLYFIPQFLLCFAGFLFLDYLVHKKDWAAWRWITPFIGLVVGNYHCVRDFGGMVLRNPVILLFFLGVVVLYDLYMKKNLIHGRSYIVDGWDEKEVDI